MAEKTSKILIEGDSRLLKFLTKFLAQSKDEYKITLLSPEDNDSPRAEVIDVRHFLGYDKNSPLMMDLSALDTQYNNGWGSYVGDIINIRKHAESFPDNRLMGEVLGFDSKNRLILQEKEGDKRYFYLSPQFRKDYPRFLVL